jgi:fermentation-respiration switch protein FrsA (DUF1100 family)
MITDFPLAFHSHGARLAGRLFRNTERVDVRQPGVIVTGSWLTVKEQMPQLYAIHLAERGYTTFVFDFAGFGESAGDPRQAELPDRKITDVMAAADFVSTLSLVEPDTLAHLAVCAGAQYGLAAIARGSRVARFISVAGWYHDTASVAPFYGGDEGVAWRLRAGRAALERYAATAVAEMTPAYRAGDKTAAMFLEMDYYANSSRGAVPSWRNEMATLSWPYWLLFDGLSAAHHVDLPALMVHSDGCVLPENARLVHERMRGPKQMVWGEGSQTDFYDRPRQVSLAIDAADAFLKKGA